MRRSAVKPLTWVVTGAAGFIGSHLVEALLASDQRVHGLDDFSSGHPRNLDQVRAGVRAEQWERFHFTRGDVRNIDDCRSVCAGADRVLHHAALCSVPRSIADPLLAHGSNGTGFVNMLVAARDAGVARMVFATSSAVYGDNPALPLVEEARPSPLSLYAASKLMDEMYADVFSRCYGIETVGLRYFNVFGPRQDPEGAYAAVIPRWISGMIRGQSMHINGDGKTTRDFCHVSDVVQANLLAATTSNSDALNQVYNIASGAQITLNQLFALIREQVAARLPEARQVVPDYLPFRPGDVRHSWADIGKAKRLLGYLPSKSMAEGLNELVGWYFATLERCGHDGAA